MVLWLLLMLMLEVVQVMALCYDSSGQVLSFLLCLWLMLALCMVMALVR